jgi:predicted RNA binding protein with dsRBD fold (UPF0201 family)
MKSTIRCLVHPTEDIQRVEAAIENILGPITLSRTELDEFTEIHSTETDKTCFAILKQSIHDKRILAAVRVRLLKNLDEFTTYIFFGKQAAYRGKLRLIDNTHEDPPLGSRTKDGRIIT